MAPFFTKYSNVGIAARMRVSSVMFKSLSSGTFKSQRTKTVWPSKSFFVKSPTDFFFIVVVASAIACAVRARKDLAPARRADGSCWVVKPVKVWRDEAIVIVVVRAEECRRVAHAIAGSIVNRERSRTRKVDIQRA